MKQQHGHRIDYAKSLPFKWSRCSKSYGLTGWKSSTSTIRHTIASWLRMQGADIHTVAFLLGHKDLRMAARYQHLSKQFPANAVRGLDEVFGRLRYQDVTEPAVLIEAEDVILEKD
jgi:integrase